VTVYSRTHGSFGQFWQPRDVRIGSKLDLQHGVSC